MQFYNVKKREKVEIPDDQLKKIIYEAKGRKRYALRAVDDDGTNLTKFVNEETYNSADVPVE